MTELMGKNYIRKNTKTYLEVHFGQKVAGPVEIWIQLEEDCVQGMVGDHRHSTLLCKVIFTWRCFSAVIPAFRSDFVENCENRIYILST